MKKDLAHILDDADRKLAAWGLWASTLYSVSPLGYPSRTVEGKAMAGEISNTSSGVARSIVPTHLSLRGWEKRVDRIVRDMPPVLQQTVEIRYILPEREQDRTRIEKRGLFAEMTGCCKSDYYIMLKVARTWLATNWDRYRDGQHRE